MTRQTVLRLAELGGAALASWLLFRCSPLFPGDPLRPCLAIVPWVVWALSALARQAPPTPNCRRQAGFELALLVLLILLTWGRRSLGLAATDWFLVAGFLLLLAHRVVRLLVRLRPALGERLGSTPPLTFFFLPLVVYLALVPWTSALRQPDGDEPYYLLLTHSLAYDFDVDLSNNYAAGDWQHFLKRPLTPQPGDPRGAAGEIYSRHNLLLPLLLAPIYRLAGFPGTIVAMAVLTAALAWTFLRLASRYAPDEPTAALKSYALLALGPPLLLYSSQIWIEVPAALLLSLALDAILAARQEERLSRWQIVALAGAVVLLPLLKLRLALVTLPLLGLLAWRWRAGRRLVYGLGAGFLALLASLFVHNQLRFGNPLKIHQLEELGLAQDSLSRVVLNLIGMLFDCAFGLLAAAPLWLLLLPATLLLKKKRSPLLGDIAILTLPYLLALVPRLEWYGGWSPPFRYPLVFLPLLGLAMIPIWNPAGRAWLRPAAAGLLALTVVLTLIWIVIPGWTYHFADGRNHLLDRASDRLQADVARFFPSAVRPRVATWIWPLAAALTTPLLLWPRRRPVAALWGVVGLLTLTAIVPLLAVNLPTHVVEFEDPWVQKELGKPYPEPWRPQRPAYRGGWMVQARTRVTAPLIVGGQTVQIRLAVLLVENEDQPFALRLAAGETVLATHEIARGQEWQELEFGPYTWPPGQPLVVLGPEGKAPTWKNNAAIIDRAVLTWQ